MKKNVKRVALLLCVVMLCGLIMACGEGEDPTQGTTIPTGPAKYTVKVVDPLGNPVAGMAVRFMKDGQSMGMALGNDEGVATKELERGDYTLELSFTDVDHTYYVDQQGLSLSAVKTETTVVVAYTMYDQAEELRLGDVPQMAYPVDAGCTWVKLSAAGRNYFIFTPKRSGIYEFSTQGADVTVGNYGTPHFIYNESASEVVDGKFTITVLDSMIGSNGSGTSRLVIGIDSAVADVNCYLCIDRIGDAPKQLEWDVYRATYKPTKYTLPAGLTIQEFDLTADTYQLVFNENDGYYHLDSADGPVVLVRLLSANPYSGFPFGYILMGSNVGTYHYDENGELVKKVLYNDCLQGYLGQLTGEGENRKFVDGMCDDTHGVYPLTKDLETIIKNYGDYMGYWDPESIEYVFRSVPGLNVENAWLFLCCYAA